jgi:hypothetical protein
VSDIRELLEHAVSALDATPPEETVEADVLRGRTALARSRRRRMIRSSVIGAAAVTIMIGGVIAAGSYQNESPDRSSRTPLDTSSQVELVAYSGEQLDGFIVDRVPEGWFLQGSSPFALTVAPEGDTTHPDNFMGKLVVMLFSKDAKQELPKGDLVDVGGNKGVVTQTGDGVTTLSYEDGEGHFVQIQSPDVLGWTNEQLASFAEGVTVTADAQKTRG